MAEHVEAVDLGVEWNPNAPEARLLPDDLGRTLLAVKPHHDDADRSCVVLAWSGTGLTHVVLLKECVVEVVTEALSILRVEGTTLDAAVAVLRG